MTTNRALVPTPDEIAIVERFAAEAILSIMLDEEDVPPLPAEVIMAFRRSGTLSHPDLEMLIEQMPFEGPDRYLKGICKQIKVRQAKGRDLLLRLLETSDRKEALEIFGSFFRYQFGLLELFMDCYPLPPHGMISKLLPVWYHPCVTLLKGKRASLLNPSLKALMLVPPKIERYLVSYHSERPQNRFLRWVTQPCRRHKQQRFQRHVRTVFLASERLSGYIQEYLDEHLTNLRYRREYGLFPEKDWLDHRVPHWDQ